MSIQVSIDVKSLEGVKRDVARRMLRAATAAVHTTTRQLETDFEALTRAAVPGNAWRGWKSRAFPAIGQPARKPEGAVFPNGKRGSRTWGMMEYWTQPGTNRAKEGRWLAIPTKAAGSRGRNRKLTPAEWERQTGIRLHFVFVEGKQVAYLVAEMNPAAGRKKTKAVIFILIPRQRHANSVSLEVAINEAQRTLARTYSQYLAAGI